MSIERKTQFASPTCQGGLILRARHVAALGIAVGMLVALQPALAAPPNNTVPPASPPARDVQQASHAEIVPADRKFANAQPPVAAQRAAPSAAPVTEQKTRLASQGPTRERTGSASGGIRQLLATGASLALVLGLFAAVVWMMRRGMPKVSSQRLPQEVLDVLGQATLAHRQQVQLVRLGQKLLLINVSPSGAETLSEVTDAAEVDRLTALCRRTSSRSATPSFRDVLQQFRGPGVTTAAAKQRSPELPIGKSEVADG